MQKKFIPVLILIILIVIAYMFGLHESINLEKFNQHKDDLLEAKSQNPILFSFIFCLIYIITVSLSLPFASLLTLISGFLFGIILGTIYVVTAATIGSAVIFLIAKSSFGEFLKNKAGKLYLKISKELNKDAASYMLFMRLVPLFPFFLVNILPAFVNMRLSTYLWTTFFGIMPGSFIYVNLGATLATIDSLENLVSIRVIIALSFLGIFALTPIIYRRYRKNV